MAKNRIKRILKYISAFAIITVILSLTILPTFAYTSVNGWTDYAPNMPDLNLFYKREGVNGLTYPRTVTGYVSYTGNNISSQSQNGYALSTFKNVDSLGYRFTTFYAAELFWDFIYLPISASATEESFALDLSLYFTTNASDSSNDNDVSIRVGYFADSSVISVKTFTYSFENEITRDFNIYNLINDSNATALSFIQVGYDYSGRPYANQKYVDGVLTISNLDDWIRHDPYVNATSNLFSSAYENGFNDAMEQLGGADAEEFYRAGYANGYNSGYSDGYTVGVGDSTLNTTAYSTGYQVGYAEGYQAYANNVDSFLTEKYNEGYIAGFEANEGSGYNSGYSDGRLAGFNEGEQFGYSDGYYDGVNEQLQDVGFFEYIGNSLGAFFSIPLGEHFTLGGLFAIIVSIPVIIMILKLIAGG